MLPSLIDIGVNLAHAQFRGDREDVLDRALSSGVSQLIVTGTSARGSEAAVQLAYSHPGVLFATAGVHPHDARDYRPSTHAAIRAMSRRPEVVAIGECGLDFNRDFSPRPDQERAFAEQLVLAAEAKLPVFLHERDAHDRFLGILREHREELVGGVVHCFTGTAREAQAYLDLGLDLGVTGWICDERRGLPLREVVRVVPLDRLMVETDAPFLSPRDLPTPQKRNEPAFLPHILRAVAKAMDRDPAEVAAATTANALRLFSKMRDPVSKRGPISTREPASKREPISTRGPVSTRGPISTREPASKREPISARAPVSSGPASR